jgi:hypothetical protein
MFSVRRALWSLCLSWLCVSCRRADDNRFLDSARESPAESVAVVADSTCGISGSPRLDEDGIGELKQGRHVDEVTRLCDVASDTGERGPNGRLERVVVVRIAGETVRAIITNDRVSRIEINTPRFRTADSLGVDTPLRRISRMRGAQFAPGEDAVYGFSPEHCGLSFRFSVPMRPPAGGQWTTALIEEQHGDAAVNRVIVIPCRR